MEADADAAAFSGDGGRDEGGGGGDRCMSRPEGARKEWGGRSEVTERSICGGGTSSSSIANSTSFAFLFLLFRQLIASLFSLDDVSKAKERRRGERTTLPPPTPSNKHEVLFFREQGTIRRLRMICVPLIAALPI